MHKKPPNGRHTQENFICIDSHFIVKQDTEQTFYCRSVSLNFYNISNFILHYSFTKLQFPYQNTAPENGLHHKFLLL